MPGPLVLFFCSRCSTRYAPRRSPERQAVRGAVQRQERGNRGISGGRVCACSGARRHASRVAWRPPPLERTSKDVLEQSSAGFPPSGAEGGRPVGLHSGRWAFIGLCLAELPQFVRNLQLPPTQTRRPSRPQPAPPTLPSPPGILPSCRAAPTSLDQLAACDSRHGDLGSCQRGQEQHA